MLEPQRLEKTSQIPQPQGKKRKKKFEARRNVNTSMNCKRRFCHSSAAGTISQHNMALLFLLVFLNASQLHLKENRRSPIRGGCTWKHSTQKTLLLFRCCRTATFPNSGTRVVSCGSRSDLQRPKDAETQSFQPSHRTSPVTY